MKKTKKYKIIRNSIIIAIIIVVVATVGFLAWANSSYEPTVTALASMENDDLVTVKQDDLIMFTPNNVKPTKGFIFYPGGKVEPEAYATLCKEIAKEGYLVVIAPMTLDLAVLSPDKADDVIARFRDIETWAIGGHSLGGVMASSYAVKNNNVTGVVLYASYPQGDELKNTDKKVISIYGSNDGVANLDNVKNAALPNGAKLIEIQGGNHGQFGSYGEQKGDNKATISGDEQIQDAAKYTVELLREL